MKHEFFWCGEHLYCTEWTPDNFEYVSACTREQLFIDGPLFSSHREPISVRGLVSGYRKGVFKKIMDMPCPHCLKFIALVDESGITTANSRRGELAGKQRISKTRLENREKLKAWHEEKLAREALIQELAAKKEPTTGRRVAYNFLVSIPDYELTEKPCFICLEYGERTISGVCPSCRHGH